MDMGDIIKYYFELIFLTLSSNGGKKLSSNTFFNSGLTGSLRAMYASSIDLCKRSRSMPPIPYFSTA